MNQVVEQTTKCLQVSVCTVYSVCKKKQEGKEFAEVETRNRDMAVPDEFISYVRKTIMGMYKDKKHVTMKELLQKLKDRVATRILQWKWASATFYRFLTN